MQHVLVPDPLELGEGLRPVLAPPVRHLLGLLADLVGGEVLLLREESGALQHTVNLHIVCVNIQLVLVNIKLVFVNIQTVFANKPLTCT